MNGNRPTSGGGGGRAVGIGALLLGLLIALPLAGLVFSFWTGSNVVPGGNAPGAGGGQAGGGQGGGGQTAVSSAPRHQPGQPGGPMQPGGRDGPMAEHRAAEVEVSSRLPVAFERGDARRLRYDYRSVVEGQDAFRPTTPPDPARAVDSFAPPAGEKLVRVKLQPVRAQTLPGAARATAVTLHGVWLSDDRGRELLPIGYVWVKSSGELEVRYEPKIPLRTGRELPAHEMSPGDELYLYVPVRGGTTLKKYHIGPTTQKLFDYQVPE